MTQRPGVSCVVLVDKPAGPTSFDMVRVARRGMRTRVGHAGTLDPFATGLLLILIGQATRASNLLMELPKEYEVTVQFGAVSSTADPTGDIVPTGKRVEVSQIEEALLSFQGRIRQKVPMTSAVKVDGEPLYRRAHRGESIDTPEREVMVHEMRLLAFDEKRQTAQLLAVTGSGTYVRILAEDLGHATGAGGYAASLRRARCGRFAVSDALSPEELSPERYAADGRGVIAVGEALDFLPAFRLDDRQARLAANGNQLRGTPSGRFRAYGPEGLLGVYEGLGEVARPLVVFSSPA
jgi:tRNA pseudouridine55 synthase